MKKKSELQLIKEFLILRFKEPSGSVGFWLYFIFIVIIVGSVGSLLSSFPLEVNSYETIKSVSLSIIGYAVVLLCSSSVDLIFLRLKGKDEKRFLPVEGSLKMVGVILIGFSIVAVLTPLVFNSIIYNIILALFSVPLGLILWWITNSKYHFVFRNGQTTKDDIEGGSIDHKLPGNLKGYKA